MVNFLLLIESISKYSKIDIDQGQTPHDIYTLCNCIRETFCLSYSIRKQNNLFLYLRNKQSLIKFEGNNLRYLGPDERSQALLLEKALSKISNIYSSESNLWYKSTPGILVRKFESDKSFVDYIYSFISAALSFFVDDLDEHEKNLDIFTLAPKNIKLMEESYVIFLLFTPSKILKQLIKLLKDMKNIKIISLSNIKLIENKILYINFRGDQQEIINKQL